MFGTTSRFWKKSREHVWLGIAFDLNQNFVKKLSQNFALNQNYWDMDSILHYLYLKKKNKSCFEVIFLLEILLTRLILSWLFMKITFDIQFKVLSYLQQFQCSGDQKLHCDHPAQAKIPRFNLFGGQVWHKYGFRFSSSAHIMTEK
jgi:hypothetical protein